MSAAPKYRVQFYRDAKGEYRWRARHANGRIIADSGEGYARGSGARQSVHRFLDAIAVGAYRVEPQEPRK